MWGQDVTLLRAAHTEPQVNPVGNHHFHLTKENGCEHSRVWTTRGAEPDRPGLRVGCTEVTGIVQGRPRK